MRGKLRAGFRPRVSTWIPREIEVDSVAIGLNADERLRFERSHLAQRAPLSTFEPQDSRSIDKTWIAFFGKSNRFLCGIFQVRRWRRFC
jgi:hypothetical protein